MINIKAILGKNIKRLREKNKMTQDEFSEKIKLSSQAVSLIEAGKYFTTAETLDNICNHFNVPPSALFDLDSDYIQSNYSSRSEVVKDINLLLNNLNDNKLRNAVEYIQSLNNKNLEITYKD